MSGKYKYIEEIIEVIKEEGVKFIEDGKVERGKGVELKVG